MVERNFSNICCVFLVRKRRWKRKRKKNTKFGGVGEGKRTARCSGSDRRSVRRRRSKRCVEKEVEEKRKKYKVRGWWGRGEEG